MKLNKIKTVTVVNASGAQPPGKTGLMPPVNCLLSAAELKRITRICQLKRAAERWKLLF
jgi:hypothetical protein